MLHIIQNDPEVPPGNIAETLDEWGVLHVIHHPYQADPLPELRDISALIVLGGAMGANDDARHPFLYDLKILIRSAVQAGIPYLGVCLGGQLLAATLGAQVISNRWEELGSLAIHLNGNGRDDRLFRGLSDTISTFQWHHDSFDLPEGALLLAGSPVCPHQAFRVGERAWGLQFHPEVTEEIIRDWCAWDRETADRVEELVTDFKGGEQIYRQVSRTLLANFLENAVLLRCNVIQAEKGKP